MRAGHVRAETGTCLQRPPHRERLGLALHGDRLQRLVVEHPLRLPVRLLRHRHPVHRRRPLQPRRRVHHVTGDNSLPELRPSARAPPPPRPYSSRPAPATTAPGSASFSSLDRLQDPQARPHRPLRVVLMRHRRPEHRHHRIPHELLHRPPVAAPSPPAPARGTAGSAPAHPRDQPLRRSREPDQIAEQHRHHFPLLQRGRRRRLSLSAAVVAELRALAILTPQAGQTTTRPSLGQLVEEHDPPSGCHRTREGLDEVRRTCLGSVGRLMHSRNPRPTSIAAARPGY